MFHREKWMCSDGRLAPAWRHAWNLNNQSNNDQPRSSTESEIEEVCYAKNTYRSSLSSANIENNVSNNILSYHNQHIPTMMNSSGKCCRYKINSTLEDFNTFELDEVSSDCINKRERKPPITIDRFKSYTSSYIRDQMYNFEKTLRYKKPTEEINKQMNKKNLLKIPSSFNSNISKILIKNLTRNFITTKEPFDRNFILNINDNRTERMFNENFRENVLQNNEHSMNHTNNMDFSSDSETSQLEIHPNMAIDNPILNNSDDENILVDKSFDNNEEAHKTKHCSNVEQSTKSTFNHHSLFLCYKDNISISNLENIVIYMETSRHSNIPREEHNDDFSEHFENLNCNKLQISIVFKKLNEFWNSKQPILLKDFFKLNHSSGQTEFKHALKYLIQNNLVTLVELINTTCIIAGPKTTLGQVPNFLK